MHFETNVLLYSHTHIRTYAHTHTRSHSSTRTRFYSSTHLRTLKHPLVALPSVTQDRRTKIKMASLGRWCIMVNI